MVVILTDEEARARAARLRRDHDQLEMLLDRAEKYINQIANTKSTENLMMALPTEMSTKLWSDKRMKSPTPTYRSETKSPAPVLPDDRQIMSPTERMKQITIDTDSDSSLSQSIQLSEREHLQKTPDDLATSAQITFKPTLSTRSSTKSPSMPPSLSKTGQRLSKESAKSTDFSENTEASQSRNTRSSMKAASTRSASKSPRSIGSKKVASVRITSPSESYANQKTVQESPRRSGSKSPSFLKSSTRSPKSSGTKSPKPKPMQKMQEILIPSDTESEWSNLNESSVGSAKKPVQKNTTFKGNNTFNSVMNALEDDDSFNFD